jgi:PAS domain S-box-containing protein
MVRCAAGPPDDGGPSPIPDVLPFVYRVTLAAIVFAYLSLAGVAGGLLSFEVVAGAIAAYVVVVAAALLITGPKPLSEGQQRALMLLDMTALAIGLPHDPQPVLPSLFAYYLLFAEYALRCSRRAYLEALAAGAVALAIAAAIRKTFATPGFGMLEAWSLTAFVVFATSGLVGVWARGRTRRLETDLHLATRDLESRGRALHAAEIRNSAVVDSALDAIVAMDLDGLVRRWNPAAERMFGYTQAEAHGRKLAELIIPPDLRDAHEAGLARHRHGRSGTMLGRRLEMPALKRDGSAFDVELVIAQADAGGQPEFIGFLRDVTEQKRAEAQLAESVARYRQLAEAMPIGVFTAEPNGKIDYVNETLVRWTGRNPSQLLAGSWSQATHPDDVVTAEAVIASGLRGGTPIELTTRERDADGRFRIHLKRAVPIRDDDGRVVKWIGALLDVDDVLRAKREIERYLFAVAAARVSSFMWNVESDRLEFDSLFEPLLGLPKGTVKNRFRDFLDVLHPDDRDRVAGYVQDRIASGSNDFRVEYRVVQPGGGSRWIRGIGRFLRDDQGQVLEAPGVIQDVTVEVEARHGLERAREEAHRYRLAVEAAHVAAYTFDVATRRFESDNLFEQVLGFDTGTFDGAIDTLLGIVHPDDRGALTTYVSSALNDRDEYSFECRTVSSSGRIRWVRTSGRIVRDPQGLAIRAQGVSQDISVEVEILTSLEQRQKELERVNRELDDFTYIASHDLKEPLRGIHNFARFLKEDYGAKLDDEGRHMLSTLGAQAERMQRLIDDLLQIARLGRTPLARDEKDLEPVLDDVLASLDYTIRERGARIVRPAPLPRIECDAVRVGEVFRNHVVNAIKYNVAAPPEVTIACERADGQFVFRVSDNGIGIPREHRGRVFLPFKRLHAREAFGGGTGAGLTIAKKIVEAHGGTIWIEDAPGGGSTILFTLEGGAERA